MAPCAICGGPLPDSGFYIIRTDIFADPSMGAVSSAELQSLDFKTALDDLTRQMKNMSAGEIEDQVFRRFEHRICSACHRQFLANPLGLPRKRNEQRN